MKYKLIIILFINATFCFGQENDKKPYKVLKGHMHKVQNVFFSSDGKFIISHGWDNTVKIWDAKTFSEIRTLKGHTDQAWSADISPDKKFIASCNEDSYIILRNVKTQKVVWTYKNEKLEIHSAHFSPNGKYLIAGTPESDILVWKLSELIKNKQHTSQVFSRRLRLFK